MTMETVTPMMMLNTMSQMKSGMSITRFRIIFESQDSRPEIASVPKISAMETSVNIKRMFSSFCFFFCGCTFIA